MRLIILIAGIFSIISLCSCAPIVVRFIPINPNPNLFSDILMEHVIGGNVENNIKIKFTNNRNDTIWFYNQEPLRIVSKKDIFDSVQLKRLLHDNNKKNFLAPQEVFQLNLSYWSSSFRGKLSLFKDITRNEEVDIFFSYRLINDECHVDSILLQPEPETIKKWKRRIFN